jgi:type IV secretory pathway VirB4 component
MTYQIPQQLQYKEKIMFGLDFKQLAYAFVFGLISVIFFKTIGNFYIKYTLIMFSSGLGMGFIFLNLEKHIKNYVVFFKFQRVEKGNPKLGALIGIKGIENDVIIDSKGKKIAVLKVQPLNYSLKTNVEKETIIYSFQKFLNSLDFPTQILMNTESINLDDYLSSLEKRLKEDRFKEIFDDYRKHLHKLITNNKLMNRVFYMVIPEKGDLKIQTDICIERLHALNLKVERLQTEELRKLLIDFFSGNQSLPGIKALFPEYAHNFQDYFDVNGQLHRIVYASGYPRNVESGFLDKIVSALADFNLSIHIKPYPIDTMLIDLNKELQKQQSDLYSMKTKGIINPSLEIQYADTRHTLENLQKGVERLFNVSLYIDCKADTVERLNFLTKKVESELNSIMIQPKIANFRMLQGFRSTAPLGEDRLNNTRNITTEALSAFFPFTSQFLQVDDTGVWLGLNKNGIPIIKDIFKLPNPNGLVLAQSGGGKSYFCKLLITRYLLNGTKVMVIDPQGEYRNLTKYFEGETINLGRDSDTMINPLDLMGHEYVEKRLSLIDLMQVMLGKLTEPQKSFIDKAITEAYERKHITDDPRSWKNTPPILEDVLRELIKLKRGATQIEKSTISSLINRLDMYVTGVFKFMNRHTKIEFDNRLVCFDIGNLPKQVKPTVMFLVLDYVYMKMKANLDRKILLIDESWSLLSRTEDASYIFEIVKTSRKFNLGLLLINQEVEGLLNSQAGKSVLANSAYTLLMRQKPAVIKNICDTFNLSPSEREHLLTASVGEGLLMMEDDHTKIKVVASDEEHKIITTNADEIQDNKNRDIIKEKITVKGKDITINLDLNKGYFKKNKLKKEEIEYLTRYGFKLSKHKAIGSKTYSNYYVKPRFNEGLNHAFVCYDIKKFLERRGIKVDLPTTRDADIVFNLKGKRFAIEVETGTKIKKDRKMILDKIENLKKNYDEWFFVLTNNENVQEYKKIVKVVEIRWLRNSLMKIISNRPVARR